MFKSNYFKRHFSFNVNKFGVYKKAYINKDVYV